MWVSTVPVHEDGPGPSLLTCAGSRWRHRWQVEGSHYGWSDVWIGQRRHGPRHRWCLCARNAPWRGGVNGTEHKEERGTLMQNFRRLLRRLVVASLGVAAVVAVGPTAAYAAPTNDDFTGATVIGSLPYTTTQTTWDATSDPSDPTSCSNNGSVWFSYTASSNETIRADTSGSDYYTALSAWTGTQGSLTMLACNDYSGPPSRISFSATAGTTYYFMVAVCCGYGGSGGGDLQFSVSQVLPASNDNFANAMTITGLPFSDQQDLVAAGREAGEPTACFTPSNTVWYSYTATATQSITAKTDEYYGEIAAYTGNTISNLSQVGCSSQASYWPVTFKAQAGTTYLFQVDEAYSTGVIHFHLDVAPNPSASFYYYPNDPSAFDTIQFYDYSQDPAGAGIASRVWDFGDGTTSTAQNPTHRYAADGDYTVRLTVTTPDGRTGTTSRVVQVRTHDVSIVRLNVPATAHLGQTIGINVYVKNTRYPENVQVSLFRSSPNSYNGYVQVGSSTQEVAVSTTGQTTRFSFNYTITGDDVAMGKITFKASATIIGYRDALPADNELISAPVKLS
jgi:PKD repeat protein